MARASLLVLLALHFLSSSALADERAARRAAETRFHEAYVQEVIEGQVAPAAKVYLELLRDPEASAEIRAEARFRFAVCAVILGRPDEARANLTQLLRDGATPKAVRARAEEYLATIGDLGVGGELEKRLHDLVFDLGQIDPGESDVAAYRDFEIIGDAALPFLRKLLEHRDLGLKRHAFRLLARVGEDGLMERWDAKIGLAGQGFRDDVVQYLSTRPAQLRVFEQTLLALEDEALGRVLAYMPPGPAFSEAFLRKAVMRPANRSAVVELLSSVPEHRWTLLREWIRGDDPALRKDAAAAMPFWTEWAPKGVAEDLWPDWLRERGAWWEHGAIHYGHLKALVGLLSTKTLLDSMQTLLGETAAWVDEGDAAERNPAGLPTTDVVAEEIARRVTNAEATTDEVTRYESLLKREVVLREAIADKAAAAEGQVRYRVDVDAFRDRVRRLLAALPADRATELLRWLCQGPARGQAGAWASLLPMKEPRDVVALAAAIEAAPPDKQSSLLSKLPRSPKREPLSADMADAVLRVLPRLLPALGDGDRWPPLWTYDYTARTAAPEAQRAHLDALFDAAEAKGEGVFDRVVMQMLPTQSTSITGRVSRSGGDEQQALFWSTSGLDALEPRLARLAGATRRHVIRLGAELYRRHGKSALNETQRKRLAAFLRAHLDPATSDGWKTLSLSDADFPLETWLPRAPANIVTAVYRPAARADELARAWAKEPEKLNATLLGFIELHASEPVAAEVFDAVLRGPHEAPRRHALWVMRNREGRPASVDVLERILGELLGVDDPDENVAFQIYWLTNVLAVRHPSERLFPAVRFLLLRPEPELIEQGCDLAARLGREALLPDLARLLDSMDPATRTLAEKGIAAIESVAKMRSDAEARAAGIK